MFAANEREVDQTDIIMLLTPRIVRTQELTQQDLNPIFIGTANYPALGGTPPLIQTEPPEPAAVPRTSGAGPRLGLDCLFHRRERPIPARRRSRQPPAWARGGCSAPPSGPRRRRLPAGTPNAAGAADRVPAGRC